MPFHLRLETRRRCIKLSKVVSGKLETERLIFLGDEQANIRNGIVQLGGHVRICERLLRKYMVPVLSVGTRRVSLNWYLVYPVVQQINGLTQQQHVIHCAR